MQFRNMVICLATEHTMFIKKQLTKVGCDLFTSLLLGHC